MIAKRIAMNSVRKSSYAGLVAYITSTQGKSERIGEIRITNFESDDVDWAVREALAVQAENTRAASDQTYHLLIGLAPGESPAPEVLHAIEDRLCDALGYSEHQRISAVHRDTDCLHIHIAINKIHPRRLTLHDPYRDYRTLGEACAQLETEFGLQKVDHSSRKSPSENRADDMEHHAGVESLLGWIKRECLPSMQAATTWAEFHEALRVNGLQIKGRGNGLVIEADSGVVVKASSVAREASKPSLEARLGPFQPAAGEAPPPRRRYEGRPLRSRADTAALYAAYQAEQQAAATHRSVALHLSRQQRTDRIEDAKRAGRLRRAAIKLLGGSAGSKRVLYALASRALLADLRQARERQQRQRRHITEQHARRAWADWLRAKALEGHPEALAALRARAVSKGLAGNTVAGGGATTAGPPVRTTQDGITKQGTVVYLTADTAIRDDGVRLQVSRGSDRPGLAAALQLAAERYGNQITVTGGAKFKSQVAAAASAARLPITFDDPQLERQRQVMNHILFAKERNNGPRIQRPRTGGSHGFAGVRSSVGGAAQRSSGDAKPDAGRVARRPPPEATYGLRNLFQRSMVRLSAGGSVLLPRDVSRDLEHRNAEPHTGLRRQASQLAGGGTGRAAAARYVADRQTQRAKTFDIPNYSLYTAGQEMTASYAGTRTVDGQRLALLREGEAISVLPIDGATANRLRGISLGQAVMVTADGLVRTKGRGR